MSTDLCLVPDTAKTDSHIFTVQRFRNALSDTGLTGTRRTHEQQDRAGLFFIQCHYRKLLDDTVFYFFQTIVIFVQNLFCFLQINLGLFLCLPGKGSHKIQIIIQHTVFVAVFSFLFHSIQNFLRLFSGFLVHTGLCDLRLKLPHI